MTASDALTYRFADCELDAARFELRRAGAPVPVEPQVLSVLLLLVANAERLVGKDELVEKIWGGRIVSDSAISSRIKSARQAIGDDGKGQSLIRTVHGRGFRFVGEITFDRIAQPALPLASGQGAADTGRRPSIAVLPFVQLGEPGPYAFIGEAMPDELIMDLARLRWLFVIARGTSFRFRGDAAPGEIANALGVRYCLTGNLEERGGGLAVSVALASCDTGELVWAERYECSAGEVDRLRQEIAAGVVAALELQIPFEEARRARQRPIGELDAWASYHLGLDHMFRFNAADNASARVLFEAAIARDPHFARAHGGLSFTHFQEVFLRFGTDRAAGIASARRHAELALQADPLDPFSHFSMGRTHWLEGRVEESLDALRQSTRLSPNYAQGVYASAWAETLSGNLADGERDAQLALRLSPLDPLRFAMIATRALTRMLAGDVEEGARLGTQAANTPGAHKHIALIAAIGCALVGSKDEAQAWVGRARALDPAISIEAFLVSFPFADTTARETITRALAELGL